MQFETISRITMRHVCLQISRQIDNVDRTKRTLLHTNTTTDTQNLGDEGNFRSWQYFDTQFTRLDHRT